MPTKTLTIAKEAEVTEADFWAALRDYDEKVSVIQQRMAERDQEWERRRKASAARSERIEKLLAQLAR